MTRKFLITAAVTAVSTMALAQMGQGQSSQSQSQQRSSQSSMQGQTGQIAQPAGAAMTGTDTQTGQSQQQLTDKDFVKQAASSGEYEVKSAKLVQDKVDDPQIKMHAKHIEQDHQKANDELKQIAKSKNIDISSQMDPAQQRMYDQLKDQDKEQLAQTWKTQQQQAHRDAIQLFQRASTQLQDQELKQFAQKQLPILQQHQAMMQGDQSAQPAGAQLGQDQQKDQQQKNLDKDMDKDAQQK